MILQLESLGGTIEVTANLSNALLVATLPYFSDAAEKLDLPLPLPITEKHVVDAGVTPYVTSDGEWAGFGIGVVGGYGFGFRYGYVDHFQTTNSYFALQDPDEIPRFVGPVRITRDEAIELARETLTKLGIALEKVFAEQEPRVTLPEKTRTGIVPRYRVRWSGPRGEAVDMEVNADAKRVERFVIGFNPNLHRPWPQIGVTPVRMSRYRGVNPEYAWKLVPIILRAVDEYGMTLGLAIPRPLTTNHVARLEIADNGGWPHCEIELTNGWAFIYRNSMVNGFYAPDDLFSLFAERRPILIKDFVGEWNMTQAEAIALIRRSLAKLNYPTNLIRMDFAPQVHTSAITNIPRYNFWWWCENETKDGLVSKVEAEVDAEKRELKSLYFDHKAFWNNPPPIDVPISVPITNSVDAPAPEKSQAQPKPQRRPSPYKLPGEK